MHWNSHVNFLIDYVGVMVYQHLNMYTVHIAILDYSLNSYCGGEMAIWKYFKQEVKTLLLSPTDSLSRTISSGGQW